MGCRTQTHPHTHTRTRALCPSLSLCREDIFLILISKLLLAIYISYALGVNIEKKKTLKKLHLFVKF